MSITMVFRRIALAALMAFGAVSDGVAQPAEPDDPPGRVGRLSYMEGTVSYRGEDEDQWVPATINFPVTTDAAFWTESNARAEIQIGSADLRLDQTTMVQMVQLDDAATQVAIDQGAINVRLRDMPPGGVRLITPRGSVELLQPGRYHVDVSPQGQEPGDHVRIAVLEGAARIDGLASALTVTTGHSATLSEGEAHPLLAQAVELPLDTWALERERALNPQETARYVSPEMTGHQDLDRYGQWSTDPTYGAVWYPTVTAVDWAPYRYGHWAYIRPWGWTWIDDAPWGFAPFHYGRWVRVHDRWGWCPGRRVVRPVYAPALVAFVGGSSFSVAVFSGRRAPAIGWVPLGPHEVYRPHYRHSTKYIRNVNITHVSVTQINTTVIHRDRDRDHDRKPVHCFHNRDGLTVVSSSAFTGAAPVAKARVTVRDNDLRDVKRADNLDHLRPSRSAKAGLSVPVSATSGAAPARDDRPRRTRWDSERAAPPTESRSMATEPARDPDVLPQAPGPSRHPRAAAGSGRDDRRPSSRQSDGARSFERPDREAAVSPFDRRDRAEPALRAPAATPTAPDTLLSPDSRTRVAPPGRASGSGVNTSSPPGRQPNPVLRDGDRRHDSGANRRRSDQSQQDDTRSAPRVSTPTPPPGRVSNPVAPMRTAPPAAAPDRPRLEAPGGRSSAPARAPSAVQRPAETAERRAPPPSMQQRIEPRIDTRPESRPQARQEPRMESRREARPQPQAAPRRIEQQRPSRPAPQEARRPNGGRNRTDDLRRNGG